MAPSVARNPAFSPPPRLLAESEFMHNGICRAEAEQILTGAGPHDGMFLVRPKGTKLVLSLAAQGGLLEHYLMNKVDVNGTWLISRCGSPAQPQHT